MVADQRLMMGIVFIIAGVALALLAYAAFLYRRAPAEPEQGTQESEASPYEEMEAESSAEPIDQADASSESATPIETSDSEEVPAEEVPSDTSGRVADSADELQSEKAPSEPEDEPEQAPAEAQADPVLEAHDGGTPGEEQPAKPGVAAEGHEDDGGLEVTSLAVNLSQHPQTGRLIVQVGEKTFGSAQELRASQDWKEIAPILRDTVAWLTLADRPQEDEASPEADAQEDSPDSALSMVGQINEILERKLDRGEISTRAVRLVEGSAGSIRVYIGVDSYAMDEIPNPEVSRVIREAVEEWESQQ